MKPKPQNYFEKRREAKDIEATSIDTAKFENSFSHNKCPKSINYQSKVPFKRKPISKQVLYKLKPKLSASRPYKKKTIKTKMSYSSRGQLFQQRPLNISLNLCKYSFKHSTSPVKASCESSNGTK